MSRRLQSLPVKKVVEHKRDGVTIEDELGDIYFTRFLGMKLKSGIDDPELLIRGVVKMIKIYLPLYLLTNFIMIATRDTVTSIYPTNNSFPDYTTLGVFMIIILSITLLFLPLIRYWTPLLLKYRSVYLTFDGIHEIEEYHQETEIKSKKRVREIAAFSTLEFGHVITAEDGLRYYILSFPIHKISKHQHILDARKPMVISLFLGILLMVPFILDGFQYTEIGIMSNILLWSGIVLLISTFALNWRSVKFIDMTAWLEHIQHMSENE